MKQSIVYVFVFLGLQAAASVAVTGLWKLMTGSAHSSAPVLITVTIVFSLLTLAVFLLARWAEVSPAWLRTRPWMVLAWSVVAALGGIVPSGWLQEHLPALPQLMESEFDMILSDRWGYLTIGLLAPLAEEVVFRGAVLRSLLADFSRRGVSHGALWAIVASAFLFAVAHLNPVQMPHAFLSGLLLGWMYWRTGSILPGVAYHWANNTAAYVLYAFYPDPDIQLIDIFKGSELHVLLAVGFSLLIFVPALYQLHLWMRRAA